jgi:hypothetical protein
MSSLLQHLFLISLLHISTVDVKTVAPTFNDFDHTALIEDIGFSSECNFFFMNKILLFHYIGRFGYVG